MSASRIKLPMWVVPLAIAALVAVFGWWGNGRLRQTIEQQLRARLSATLEANVTALEIWMNDQTKLAAEMAGDSKVQTLALGLLERSGEPVEGGRTILAPGEVGAFLGYLRQRVEAAGYGVPELVSTNFAVIASPRRVPGMQVSEAHTNKFAELFRTGNPIIITPFKPEFSRPPPPRGGRGGPGRNNRGGTNLGGGRQRAAGDGPRGGGQRMSDAARGRRGERALMQAAAPVKDDRGIIRGALALDINPDSEFTKILSVARSGESGETYAFDQTGLMISRSRFEDYLKKNGLLDATNSSSALNLRLHDPKAEAVEGVKPLTRMVAEAVVGEDGLEVEPSRDYRGIEVVGAWRWLPEQGFGVVTQMDAAEAYQPLRVLKLLFIMLCVLLLLCSTGMFVFSYANFNWRRRLSEAELKLKQLGQYTLEEKIGEGGMGVVYRARHALMRRDTAVKLLLPNRADAAAIQRFEREVRLSCQLTHPNTIQVYDYGHTPEGIFYYAMEYLRGVNLHELVARFDVQPEGRVIHILTQICDSLAEAHAVGLVHRDIKPANVFLCNRGGVPDCVKVLDFGLVREYGDAKMDATQTAAVKGIEGTPWFMPPEAIKDSTKSDPRGDIYSVGALGYFLLTGQFVFDGQSMFELCEQHLKQTPVPPSQRTTNPISAEMDRAILKCLEKDPGMRPQTVVELRTLLLASPKAADWPLEARAAWWERYREQAGPRPSEGARQSSTPRDVTVRIDFASRT